MKLLQIVVAILLLSFSKTASAQIPQNVVAKSMRFSIRPAYTDYTGDSNILYYKNGKVYRTHITGGSGGGSSYTAGYGISLVGVDFRFDSVNTKPWLTNNTIRNQFSTAQAAHFRISGNGLLDSLFAQNASGYTHVYPGSIVSFKNSGRSSIYVAEAASRGVIHKSDGTVELQNVDLAIKGYGGKMIMRNGFYGGVQVNPLAEDSNGLEVLGRTHPELFTVNTHTDKIKIADGTEGIKKILSSEADGTTNWKTLEQIDSRYDSLRNGLIADSIYLKKIVTDSIRIYLYMQYYGGLGTDSLLAFSLPLSGGGGGAGWLLPGNTGTNSATDIVGTADSTDLNLAVNNYKLITLDRIDKRITLKSASGNAGMYFKDDSPGSDTYSAYSKNGQKIGSSSANGDYVVAQTGNVFVLQGNVQKMRIDNGGIILNDVPTYTEGGYEVLVKNSTSGYTQKVNIGEAAVVASNDLYGQTTTLNIVSFTTPNDATVKVYDIASKVKITATGGGSVTTTINYTDQFGTAQSITYYSMGTTTAAISSGTSKYPVAGEIDCFPNTNVSITATVTGTITYTIGATVFFKRSRSI